MASITVERHSSKYPEAERRVELCYDRKKEIVWLQMTYSNGRFFETAYIGAIPTASGGWAAIDLHTALRSRDNVLAFGTKLSADGGKIDQFQSAIMLEWYNFNGARPTRWAKGLTFGHDLSSPSFVMKAIKTGFDAIGVGVAAYDGRRSKGYTVEDTILYLQKRAAAVGIATRDSGLLDFKEIIPFSDLKSQEDRAWSVDKRVIPHIVSKRSHGGRFAYADKTASIPFPRVNTYGFRGDQRAPSGIKSAGGFNPSYTRPDHIDKAIASGKRFDEALDILAYVKNATLGGYISTPKSYAVAKSFAADMTGTGEKGGGGSMRA